MWRWAILLGIAMFLVTTPVALAEPTEQIGISATGSSSNVTLPVVNTTAATNITSSSATLNGNITDNGGETCDIRAFVWDTTSRSEPNNTTAPADTDYTYYWTESGAFGTGAFSHGVTLAANTTYYFRAVAHNSQGYKYGDEGNLTTSVAIPTLPGPPLDLTLTAIPSGNYITDSINITWLKGTQADYTLVRVKLENYPDDVGDGEEIYYGTGTNTTYSGLSLNTTEYYIVAYSWNSAGYSVERATAKIGGERMVAIAVSILLVGVIGIGLWQRSIAIWVAGTIGCFVMVPYWSEIDGRFAAPLLILAIGLAVKLAHDVIRGRAQV